jgi:hypothetical protein
MGYHKERIKKIYLPPTNLKGVESYLRNRGYRINPLLQDRKPRAKLTFDKPLPDGRRLHGGVYGARKGFYIKQHIDTADPYRNPIGHLLKDYGSKRRSSSSFVKKRTTRKRRGKRRLFV